MFKGLYLILTKICFDSCNGGDTVKNENLQEVKR